MTTSVAQTIDDVTSSVIRHVGTGWGGDRLVDWTGSGSNLRYYGTNGHHDVTWTGSDTGTVSAPMRYDPWGILISSTGSSIPDFRFQGSWVDTSTSLSWVVTRWYVPALGQFASEDSLLGAMEDPPSRHLYAYAKGEPVAGWDPVGQAVCRFDPEDCAALEDAKQAARRNDPARQRAKRLDAEAFRRYDRVLAFMHREMTTNARGTRFGKWDYGTRFCYQLGPCSEFLILPPDATNNAAVLAKFGVLVRPGGDWDHKADIRKLIKGAPDRYTPIRGNHRRERIYYDIWSNIHYGYVGRSHGIPAGILMTGQFLAEGINTEADNISIRIGIQLWRENHGNVGKRQIQQKILNNMAGYRRVRERGFLQVKPGIR